MDCKDISEMLTDYINRRLTANENIIVISHLAVCRNCREEAAMLIKIKNITAPEEVPPEIICSAFEKIPHGETGLDRILNSGSVFMAFDIIRYSLNTANKTIRLACQAL